MTRLLKILLIEDDDEFSEIVRHSLENVGYFLKKEDNVIDALFRLKYQKYDCILLDIKLNRGSGEEILFNIRKNKLEPNFKTPVIVISGTP